ncbi:P-loop containing nucleoside triphosphate hydrolase protein [Dioszegia hungarica]|uniref:RNA helicase n=1 Tax=Dioszegia hungarica TaxID=4972 RepID=A0AA38LSX5_9TREE|nr:P-loop containing nucleoside triphosphate hydrolase protein [Dioszegia hungarica]KAI9633104.1 P-loop containing nucleoside triphosphate hydrolase protein [Dioszegia hungarica]
MSTTARGKSSAGSAFNLLTAGGARFDKTRFKHDHELFTKPTETSKPSKKRRTSSSAGRSGTQGPLPAGLNVFSDPSSSRPIRPEPIAEDSDSNSDSKSSSSSTPAPAPPTQKITLSGPSPLPASLHANLPSLLSHPNHPLPQASGKPLLRALDQAGIKSLWGVQASVGGCVLDGKDVMCVAPTGSGKTLAYVLPVLVSLGEPARIRGKGEGVRAVILVPTHDLGQQILGVVKAVTAGRAWRVMALSKATEKAVWRAGSLGLDILIATPERLHHLVQNQQLSLAKTLHLVMDEADRLLSPDFLPQVQPIVSACLSPKIQKVLLSATIPASQEAVARGWMKDGGVRVVVGIKDSAVSTVAQSLLFTATESGKLLALRNLLSSGSLPYPSLIFVQSIQRADDLYAQLQTEMDGVRVGVVHGGKSNKERDEVVKGFREGGVWVLVVTEVMARGMDFGGVKVVVNYDFPQTVQSYIHRIGRTGRAGRAGKAITFFSNEDAPHLRTIANVLVSSGCPVPQYMLDLPAPNKNLKRHLAKAPVKRKVVGGGGRDLAREERRRKGEMVRGSKRRKGGGEDED